MPADLPPDELTSEVAVELLNAPRRSDYWASIRRPGTKSSRRAAGSGRTSPRSRLPAGGAKKPRKTVKPRTASLFKDMDPTAVTPTTH